jgi:mevalonate kinase
MSIGHLHISAPGKIILSGEHAVVYGKKALACSINLRTNIFVNKLKNENNVLKINFSNLNDKLLELTEDEFSNLKNSNKKENIDDIINNLKNQNTDDHLNAVYLLILQLDYLRWSDISNYMIEIKTELPIGAGLGSSASLSSCLVSVFLILSKKVCLEDDLRLTAEQLNLINEYTFNLEKFFHGKASGIDNTVVLNGNYILFQNGKIIEKFKSNLNLNILIINSKIAKQTREQVAKVRKLHDNYMDIGNMLMDTIDLTSDRFIKCLKQEESSETLNELMRMNQGLLYALGISNYKLNTIVNISTKYNYPCKITGAGGGGCCFSLIGKEKNEEIYENYLNELNSVENIDHFQAVLGCEGLKIEKVLFF